MILNLYVNSYGMKSEIHGPVFYYIPVVIVVDYDNVMIWSENNNLKLLLI